jgi:hypothetical protein
MRLILWTYATGNHRLVDSDIDPKLVKSDRIVQLIGIIIILIAVSISFISVIATFAIYYTVAIFYMVVILGGYGFFGSKSAEKSAEKSTS